MIFNENGSFIENDFGNKFLFTDDKDSINSYWESEGVTHLVKVGNDEYRYAKVLKTVAYIAIGEYINGGVLWDKWNIKNRKDF